MTKKIPIIAIIGRTNVGKSSLFNAIAKRRIAIVEDEHGVTRDRNYCLVNHYGFPFTLIDTGGLVSAGPQDDMHESIRAQTELAVEEADLILAVFDAKEGLNPQDKEVVNYIRRTDKPVIWAVNKSESSEAAGTVGEFYALGIDNLVAVSAEHRKNIDELIERIKHELSPQNEAEESDHQDDSAIRVAIVGRPNVGKSSLVNSLIGEQRLISADIPGTTRDSIDTSFQFNGRELVLVDTAGLRKKSRVAHYSVEKLSNLRTLNAISNCDVAVLVLDASAGAASEQDLKIAKLAHERGRAIVIAVNKWDLVEKDHRSVKNYKDAIRSVLPMIGYAPIVFVSAETGKRCRNLLEKVLEVYETARFRIPTHELNSLLQKIFQKWAPPIHRGEPIKLFFAAQTATAPPTIVMFLNHPQGLPDSYKRYIKSSIREQFAFEGSDLKLVLRKKTSKSGRRSRDGETADDTDQSGAAA